MFKLVVAAFIVLHGLVHLLYAGQGWRIFELQAGMTWPDGSWAFSQILGERVTRSLVSTGCVLSALGFAAAGLGLLLDQTWWQSITAASAVLSSFVFVLAWNGKPTKLAEQGLIALLINAAILVGTLVFDWPG